MKPALPWLQDEAAFQRELAAGNAADLYVATVLLRHQLAVYRPKKLFRPDVKVRDEFTDDGDLFAATHDGAAVADWHRVEVKSYRQDFTGPDDWKRDPIVCSLTGYCAAAKRTAAVFVFASKITGGCCWLPNVQRDTWRIEQIHDTHRNYTHDVYIAPKAQLRAMDSLADYLRQLKGNP